MAKLKFLIIATLLLSMLACSTAENEQSTSNENSNLPPSTGNIARVLVVSDTTALFQPIIDSLRNKLTQPAPGLINEEQFTSFQVSSWSGFSGGLLKYHSLIIPVFLDRVNQDITKAIANEEVINRVKEKGEFLFVRQDIYAKGQQAIFMVAENQADFFEKLQRDEQKLLWAVNDHILKRYLSQFKTDKKSKEAANKLKKEFGLDILLPAGYQLVTYDEKFIWFRDVGEGTEYDCSIFISEKPYQRQEQFETDSILNWRNSLAKQYLFANEDTSSYMLTENLVPVYTKKTRLHEHFAIEMRGLWRINQKAMGGCFVSYTFTDVAKGKMYYVEGFLYAPGQSKLAAIRKLEAIIKHTIL